MSKLAITMSDIIKISDAAQSVFNEHIALPYDNSRNNQVFLIISGLEEFLKTKGIEVPFELVDTPKKAIEQTPLDDM
jgi:hypothetical protein